MQRFGLGVAAVSMLVLTGCIPMNVSSYKERDIDFARFQTYSWAPAADLSTGDPRLDNNPFFHEYFRDAVEARMNALGLRRAIGDDPDLLIRYRAVVSQSFSVAAPDPDCHGDRDCAPGVLDSETGAFSLDVVDSTTNRTVWRGWSRQSVSGLIDNQEWMEQYISKSVERMMKGFALARATNQTHEQ
jgi:hypothetical protein